MLSFFRHSARRSLVWLTLVMLVVPVLLTVMPSSGLAEEIKFLDNLQVSDCTEKHDGFPVKDHSQCQCVLCIHADVARPALVFQDFDRLCFHVRPLEVAQCFVELSQRDFAAIDGPGPGRGPPIA